MNIDSLFIEFVHALCVNFGVVLTPFFRFITFLGEKSWLFLLICLVLCLNKKTRWIGATAILAIFMGWLLADYGVKPLIDRPRPYTIDTLYISYWELAGAIPETNSSMPSGHTLGVAAFFISLFITSKKSWRKNIMTIGIIMTTLMILSRTYLMHHYLTDCLVGVLLALVTSFIAKPIVKFIHRICKKYENIGIFKFILNFDVLGN